MGRYANVYFNPLEALFDRRADRGDDSALDARLMVEIKRDTGTQCAIAISAYPLSTWIISSVVKVV
jgi:hypothetical protein